MLSVLEELEERAEKRFEEREERMRKYELEIEERRLAREEKMEQNMMHMFTSLLQTITPHPHSDPYPSFQPHYPPPSSSHYHHLHTQHDN